MALTETLKTVVDSETKAALEALALKQDRSVGSVIRRAVRAYLDAQKAEEEVPA